MLLRSSGSSSEMLWKTLGISNRDVNCYSTCKIVKLGTNVLTSISSSPFLWELLWEHVSALVDVVVFKVIVTKRAEREYQSDNNMSITH